MTESAGQYDMRQLLDGIMGGSTPAIAGNGTQTPAITVNGGTVVIGDGNHVYAPPARISEAQSRLLKSLVARIGKAERARNPSYSDARTWTQANAVAGVDHHRDIPKRDLDQVILYLKEWIRRLEDGQQ